MTTPFPSGGPQDHPGHRGVSPAPSARPEDEVLHLRDLLLVVRRHRLLIAAVTAVIFGFAVYKAYTAEPLYRARALIRLQDQRRALTGGLGGEASQVLGKQNDPLLSQLQVLRSRTVAAEVVHRMGLRLHSRTRGLSTADLRDVAVDDRAAEGELELTFRDRVYLVKSEGGATAQAPYGAPVKLGGVRFTVAKRPAMEQGTLLVLDRESAIDGLLGGLRAVPREKTDVVDVEYVSNSPELAQQVVNATVTVFRDINLRTAQEQAVRRRRFLEEQLVQTDSILAQAQTALTAFRERSQVFSSQQQVLAEQEGLRGVELRRNELEADLQVHRSLLQRLRQSPGGRTDRGLRALMSLPAVGSNAVLSQLYGQMVRYETSLDSLTAGEWGSAGTDPQVQRLSGLVSATRQDLMEAVAGHVTALEARIASLDRLRAQGAAQLSTLPATEAEEGRVMQRVETVREVAQQLREEYQRARIAEAVEAGEVQVVDLAAAAGAPVGTRRSLKLMLGLMLGLMMGTGAAFLREHLNTAIRADEIESVLGIPSLVLIPQFAKRGARRWGARRDASPAAGEEGGELRELVALTAPHSAGAEAFRTLRTNLLFSQADRSLRSLVVTSTSPAEGKTTVSANLGLAFAQQGLRVLLVDGDLRRPRLHEPFQLSREPGLTDLAMGYRTREEVIRPAAGVEGLFLLPAGTLPPNPSEFVGSPRMRAVLSDLGESFDLLLVDTPPVQAAADAAILASMADGVMLVLRAGKTGRNAAQFAVREVARLGGRLLGVVVNDPDAQMQHSEAYYGYSYGYGKQDDRSPPRVRAGAQSR